MVYIEIVCSKCGGSGEIICPRCKGAGGWNETSGGVTYWRVCSDCIRGRAQCNAAGCHDGKVKVKKE